MFETVAIVFILLCWKKPLSHTEGISNDGSFGEREKREEGEEVEDGKRGGGRRRDGGET